MLALPSLKGWRRVLLADGALLVPQEGDRVGRVRVRLAEPLLPVEVFVARVGASLRPRVTELTSEPPRFLVTLEGEHAVLVTMLGGDGAGHRMERTLGIIYGDERAAVIDGIVQDPAFFPTFRKIVATMTERHALGLGELRRRWFLHDPLPAGWQGLRRHHATSWIAPGYPKRNAAITVFDARPNALSPWNVQDRQIFEDLPGDLVPDVAQPPIPVTTHRGLKGQIVPNLVHLPGGTAMAVHNCALDDGRFVYFFRLEAVPELLPELRPIFGKLVESTVPVPRAEHKPGTFIEWQD